MADSNRSKTAPLASRFPHLWRSPRAPEEFREDLDLTEVEFGRKYRRGKAARLAELQLHEDQLALTEAAEELGRARPLLVNLGKIGNVVQTLLDARAFRTVDAESAEAAYRLATISLRPEARVEDHELEAVLDELKGLCKDALDRDILRESICSCVKRVADTKLGRRHEMTRQSVAERRHKLINRLVELGGRRPIASLLDFIIGRIDHRTGKPCLHADDPFVQIALINTGSDSLDARDAVAVGIWLASDQGGDSKPRGFIREGDLLTIR
jgi:hypothetical protein